MKEKMLNTRNENTICISLANILGVRKEAVEVFLAKTMPDYVCKEYWEINEDIFYDYFELKKDTFVFDEVIFYHVTTRLSEQKQGEFRIDNMETTLLTDNPLTELCSKHDIIFKKEEGISVYYQKKKIFFEKPMEARLRNRLNKINDSSVNGFLFPELLDNCYIGLTGMPEIFSDIMGSLNRRDIQEEYFKQKKCYLVTVAAKIENLIFDGTNPKMTCQEKTQSIVRYLLCYLGYLKTFSDLYVKNPVVRLEDKYCVPAEEIVEIREIYDYKEIFKH